MKLAFLTGALAAGVAGALIAALVIWVVTVITATSGAWGLAGWVIAIIGLVVGGGTYLAEHEAHARTMARMRGTGEPWAYRR
jgi:Na+/melibiose symporter-like transporter